MGLRSSLSVVALVIVVALFLARMLPETPVGATHPDDAADQGGRAEEPDPAA